VDIKRGDILIMVLRAAKLIVLDVYKNRFSSGQFADAADNRLMNWVVSKYAI
jgi:hypothetical protein